MSPSQPCQSTEACISVHTILEIETNPYIGWPAKRAIIAHKDTMQGTDFNFIVFTLKHICFLSTCHSTGLEFITLRASCGAVYCNRSCLFECGSVTMITRNCVHRSSPNWDSR